MAVGEHHVDYARCLIDEVDTRLGKEKSKDFSSVWAVVETIVNCQLLHNITSEEAEIIYYKVFELYPDFKVPLMEELERHNIHQLTS